MSEKLSQEDRDLLLKLARQALEDGTRGQPLKPLDNAGLPETLRQPGATFVTLTRSGELRGCVGTLEAYQPLAEDVREHALAAALQDYRFPPVSPREVPELEIEVSRLTTPVPLEYEDGQDLLSRLRPGVDGVILRDGFRRATFLPQVWEKLPDPAQFLDHLCMKMGNEANAWRYKKMKVFIYQVEEFHEQ
jgi:AmmeMemoRadiSam system protein A